ncbi:MAG: esterase [Burkholderiaceae bacterium]|nr:esterase [Burkholderiaceae bacterium]
MNDVYPGTPQYLAASADSPQVPATRCTHLLYLHGFRSSPRSAKAMRMAQWVAQHRPDLHFACPQLPPSPAESMALMQELTQGWPLHSSALMGSSLGGFYATAMAQQPGWEAVPTVLLNPAVDPARDLAGHIGVQTCWQDPQQRFFVRPEFMGELQALDGGELRAPARFLAVIAKGDEVLDWREMQARYAHCRIHLLPGSDHGLTADFEGLLPELSEFLRL